MEVLLFSFIILSAAIMIDRLVGEPPSALHPTVWMGRLAESIRSRIKIGKPMFEKLQGSLLALVVIGIFSIPAYYVLILSMSYLGFVAFLLISIFLFKSTFAIRAMERFTLPIAEAARKKDYSAARSHLKRVVRRNPRNLNEQQVLSAAVETIAEGTVDGVTGPVFFYSLFGVPGALAHRAINTLDSTVGYKDRRNLHIGWLSAKLDTLVNYIPARLTALFTIMSARVLGADWKNSLDTLKRDHGKTESANAGWSISAMAGALGVGLEKPGNYALGRSDRDLHPDDIKKALKIMRLNALFFILTVAIPVMVATSILLPQV